jgi:hypothetical protein
LRSTSGSLAIFAAISRVSSDLIVIKFPIQQTPDGRALARMRMHAREKSLKNFGLVPLRFASVQRCRALAVIISLMPTSELLCDWSSVMALSISGSG